MSIKESKNQLSSLMICRQIKLKNEVNKECIEVKEKFSSKIGTCDISNRESLINEGGDNLNKKHNFKLKEKEYQKEENFNSNLFLKLHYSKSKEFNSGEDEDTFSYKSKAEIQIQRKKTSISIFNSCSDRSSYKEENNFFNSEDEGFISDRSIEKNNSIPILKKNNSNLSNNKEKCQKEDSNEKMNYEFKIKEIVSHRINSQNSNIHSDCIFVDSNSNKKSSTNHISLNNIINGNLQKSKEKIKKESEYKEEMLSFQSSKNFSESSDDENMMKSITNSSTLSQTKNLNSSKPILILDILQRRSTFKKTSKNYIRDELVKRGVLMSNTEQNINFFKSTTEKLESKKSLKINESKKDVCKKRNCRLTKIAQNKKENPCLVESDSKNTFKFTDSESEKIVKKSKFSSTKKFIEDNRIAKGKELTNTIIKKNSKNNNVQSNLIQKKISKNNDTENTNIKSKYNSSNLLNNQFQKCIKSISKFTRTILEDKRKRKFSYCEKIEKNKINEVILEEEFNKNNTSFNFNEQKVINENDECYKRNTTNLSSSKKNAFIYEYNEENNFNSSFSN